MRIALAWFWFAALILELVGCGLMIFKLSPADDRFALWWRRSYILISCEVVFYFWAISLRDSVCPPTTMALACSTLARWSWTIAIGVMAGYVYRKLK